MSHPRCRLRSGFSVLIKVAFREEALLVSETGTL